MRRTLLGFNQLGPNTRFRSDNLVLKVHDGLRSLMHYLNGNEVATVGQLMTKLERVVQGGQETLVSEYGSVDIEWVANPIAQRDLYFQ
jgi:hypothetical protein